MGERTVIGVDCVAGGPMVAVSARVDAEGTMHVLEVIEAKKAADADIRRVLGLPPEMLTEPAYVSDRTALEILAQMEATVTRIQAMAEESRRAREKRMGERAAREAYDRWEKRVDAEGGGRVVEGEVTGRGEGTSAPAGLLERKGT